MHIATWWTDKNLFAAVFVFFLQIPNSRNCLRELLRCLPGEIPGTHWTDCWSNAGSQS